MTDPQSPKAAAAPGAAPPQPDQIKDDLASALGVSPDDDNNMARSQSEQLDGERLKEAATAQLSGATEKAKGFVAARKDAVADSIDHISSAMDKVAQELGSDDATAEVAGYARNLAGGIRHASETVRNNSIDDIVSMMQDFGRRQPIAFLGASALAGFVAARFVKASAERHEGQHILGDSDDDTLASDGGAMEPMSSTSGPGNLNGGNFG